MALPVQGHAAAIRAVGVLGNSGEAGEQLIRVGEAPPMAEPVGLAVALQPGKHAAPLFVSDAATSRIWRTDLSLSSLTPTRKGWAPVADGGRIVMLEPTADGYRRAWSLDRWGDGAGERFGPRLRMAIDGPWMLVSDTARHRVVWLGWQQRTALGQLGHTDAPGSDATHLDAPTLVALRDTRAAIADSGNQRVIKATLVP